MLREIQLIKNWIYFFVFSKYLILELVFNLTFSAFERTVMSSLLVIGQQVKEKRKGAQFWSYCLLSPSVDPAVLVDLFWFVQKCRLLKQGKIMT